LLYYCLALLGAASAAAPPEDAVALAVARSRAALAVDAVEAAIDEAAEALALGPGDWRAHRAWQLALERTGADAQLSREYALLSESEAPELAWLGTARLAEERHRPLSPPAELPASGCLAATLALADGYAHQAVGFASHCKGPEGLGLGLAAHLEGGQPRKALAVARQLADGWPDRSDLRAPTTRMEGRGVAALRSAATGRAAEALGSEDVLAVYRAHTWLAAAGEVDLALAAAARLVALGEPYALGGREPWRGAMVRDLARILAMQRSPEVPAGGAPAEAQRILAAAARAMEDRGREEEARTLWRQAVAVSPPPPALALAAARALGGEEAGVLVTDALANLSRTAVDPGEQARHRQLLEEAWSVPGGHGDRWLAASRADVEVFAVLAAKEPTPELLQSWAEALEAEGHPRAALSAQARAVAAGAAPSEATLLRLYRGPAHPSVLVEAWAAAHAAPEVTAPAPQGPRVPDWTLQTEDGPLRIGDPDGTWTVLNFWASWCGPCQLELPELAELAEEAAAAGLPVRVVAVSMDDRKGDYERWVARHDTPGLVLAWDPGLGRALQLRSVPTTLLIDPQGVVQVTRRGYTSGDGERLLQDLRTELDPTAEE